MKNYIVFLVGQQIVRVTNVSDVVHNGEFVDFYKNTDGKEEELQATFNRSVILGYCLDHRDIISVDMTTEQFKICAPMLGLDENGFAVKGAEGTGDGIHEVKTEDPVN